MNRFAFYLLLAALSGTACGSLAPAPVEVPACATSPQPFDPDHPLAEPLQRYLDSVVARGLPGAVIAVKTPAGRWVGASGLARIEDAMPLLPCQAQHGYSISKTYMAAAAMRLWDQGRLDLDAPAIGYLPATVAMRLPTLDGVTVRMLLNHTSGLPEFHTDWRRLTDLLDNPDRRWTREALLAYVEGKPRLFAPGTNYAYSNTNFLLLTYVLEQAGGADHATVLENEVLRPLGLLHTWYKRQPGYPDGLSLPNAYWDRYANGILENCSRENRNIAAHSGYGEDGVIATPLDFIEFMDALANGRLLSEAAWQEMTTWVQGASSTEPDYGLGLVWVNFAGGPPEFGHYGGGVGGRSVLLYLPAQKTTVFVATNLGAETGGPLDYVVHTFVNGVPAFLAR